MKNQRYNIIAFWGDSEPWFLIANEHTIKELENYYMVRVLNKNKGFFVVDCEKH